MNCPDFESVIIEIARDGLMDAAARERGLEHVRGCASCAVLLGEERALSSDLRVLSAESAADRIPERIETELLAAFRERRAAPVANPIVATRNRRRTLAVAALALLAFSLALAGLNGLREKTAAPSTRKSPASDSDDGRGASAPAVIPAPERATGPSPMVATQKQDRSISRLRPEKRGNRPAKISAGRRPLNDIAPNEYVTQFFPVMQGGELIPLESGRIVRVRMPRSNLIPLGIPFNQERANETIKADVLLSNDGLARAIRLVY